MDGPDPDPHRLDCPHDQGRAFRFMVGDEVVYDRIRDSDHPRPSGAFRMGRLCCIFDGIWGSMNT